MHAGLVWVQMDPNVSSVLVLVYLILFPGNTHSFFLLIVIIIHRCKFENPSLQFLNSFAADFLAPSAGKNIYVREIKLQPLPFVNTAITVANGTEGVLSTFVANDTGTVSTSRQRQRKS